MLVSIQNSFKHIQRELKTRFMRWKVHFELLERGQKVRGKVKRYPDWRKMLIETNTIFEYFKVVDLNLFNRPDNLRHSILSPIILIWITTIYSLKNSSLGFSLF